MKIEEDAAAASTSFAEMPPASANLLHAIKTAATADDFIHELNKGREVHSVMGKTELCRWSEVLNRCDEILENASKRDEYGQMNCDKDAKIKKHSIAVIRFTVLLFECTSSRRIYRSMDRVLALMESADMELLAEVLRLLQTMGKRSKYLTQRLCPSDQTTLVQYLTAIAQCWGGKLRTVKMADCVKQNAPLPALFPFTYSDSLGKAISVERPTETECVASLVSRICKLQSSPTPAETSSPSETMASTQPDPPNVDAGNVASAASGNMSADDRYYLLSRVRMLHGFESRVHRVRCLVVRLLSVSTLIYCRCQTEDGGIGALLYTGFVEELVALLKAERETDTNEDSVMLDVIHTEALTTLCSIVSLEKEPKIQQILEALSAGSYHGFLSVLTRQIVDELKKNELGKPGKPSIALSTALFSFIYHLASIEPGGETLVGSGLMQTLLGVIAHHTLPIELITFGTRCARIIDLFTTIDVTAFRNNNGMEICVDRIVYEINQCRKEQPFMIDVSDDHCFANEEPDVAPAIAQPDVTPDIIQEEDGATANTSTEGSGQGERVDANTSTADQTPDAVAATPGGPFVVAQRTGLICHQQRSGLIKGLLTFVKRAIQDAQFQESIRHIMDGGLPEALMHILSNAEYYSPSLFHQSAQVITNFVYQEPDQLTALQRRHVSFVILQSLLRKELPNSRDVIGHMGTVFTALCLNERGLRQFKSYEPFDQIFRILLSVKFLVTMKKKRTEMTEAAQSIGAAFDDLLRHHPTLKPLMLKSISKVLDRLMVVGNNPPEGTTIVMALAKQTARSMARGSLGFALNSDSVLVPVATNTTSTSTASNVAVSQSRGPGMRFLHANRSHGRAVTQYTSSLYAYSTVPVVENVDMREVHENVALALPQDDPAAAMIMEEEDGSDVDEDEMSMDEMTAEVASSGSSQRAAADDENIMNMDNKSGNVCTAKRTRDNLGLDMDCDDENGKRILPLGDFMLISAKIFETLLTQQSAAEMVDGFIEDDGLEKLLALCQLPCLNHEIAHSSFSQNVANIIKFTILHRNTRSTERLMKSVMNSFLRTLSPLITNDNSALAASSSDAPCSSATQTAPSCSMMMHLGEETILNSLTNLNNIMPVLVTVNKCSLGAQFVAEVRNRVWDHWLTPNGVKLHAGFRKLSRMLVWEAALIHVLKPSIRTCSTQTDPGELSATIDNAGPRTMDGGDQRADVDFCTSTDVTAEPRLPAWVVAGISTEEHAFWIQHKNIADLVVRTSKSVSDFLSVLSRSIFSTTTRHRNRRFNEYNQQSSEMFEPAKQLATMIFNSIYRDLKWTNPRGGSNTPMEYARLTELLSQMSTSLFDDRGKVAHTTLVQLFYARGCHKAFFDMFTDRLIPTLKTERHGNSGLEEVLLEWCRLASRLAIRQNMLPAADAENRILGFRQRQPFQIGASTEFDINKYLKLVHYDLFNSFTLLFEKLSSEEADLASYQNLSEMSITVFREVVSNLCPSKERPAGSGETSVALREGNLEENELRHLTLVEMGFLPEQAVQALETTGGNVDEAADLLINGGLRSREEQANERIDEASREVVRMISGREGLIRSLRDGQSTEAIARDVLNSANLADEPQNIQIPTATNNLNRLVDQILQEYVSQHVDDISVAHEAEEPPQERQIPISDVRSVVEAICHALMSKKSSADEDEAIEEPLIPPLRDLRIEQDVSVQAACIQLMPLCKRMMQIGTDMVYSCADLVASIIPALDETWRRGQLIGEMLTQEIIAMSAEAIRQPTETGIRKLATRIHFACLLFDQLAEEYIDIAQQHPLIDNLLLLIGFIDENFETNYVQNALLPTVILWLDLFDKNSRSLRRRKLLSSHTTNLAWTYLGDEDRLMGASRTKKWQPYSAKEQATINSAFFAGKQTATVRLSSGRDKEVEIDFVTMKHYDTGSNTAGMAGVSRCSVRAELPDTVNIDVEKIISEERKQAWSQGENGRLLLLLVRLLYKGFIHHVAAHSLLSFTARLTKNPENAMNFMKQGGVSAILQLKCTASGSTKALVSMIIRYCIEDELMVSQMFEKCIRAATSTHTMPIGEYLPLTTSRPKEWHETLNKLAPLTSRSPDLFLAAMERVAKMEGANMVAVPSNKLPASMPVSNERAIEVVNQFLHEAVHGEWEMNLPIGRSRMLSRASIIGVLSELVKSYAGIANIICEAKDSNGQSVMYALIENYIDSPTEKDVVSALRTLVTMIAACNHSPKAQELIVMDVKAALMSVWTTPASTQQDSTPAITPLKPLAATPAQGPQDVASTSAFGATTSTSKKITEICALIVTMCDNCPSHPATSIASNFATSRNSPAQPNHITKLFHKKKICNDLVKTITYLQLSQKESFETINQILKTLETLMKSVGVPPTQSATGTATTERRIEVGVSTDTERRDGDAAEEDEDRFQIEMILEAGVPRRAGDVEDHYDYARDRRIQNEDGQWDQEEVEEEEGSEIDESSEESGSDETVTEEDDEQNSATVRDDTAETADGGRVADVLDNNDDQDEIMDERNSFEGDDDNEADDQQEGDDGGEAEDDVEADQERPEDGDREEEEEDEDQVREEDEEEEDGDEVDSLEEEADYDDELTQNMNELEVLQSLSRHRLDFMERGYGILGQLGATADFFGEDWGLIAFRTRPTDQRESLNGLHPLLIRPPMEEASRNRTFASAQSHNSSTGGTRGSYTFLTRPTNSGQRATALGEMNQPHHLHRQNAIRRFGNAAGPEGTLHRIRNMQATNYFNRLLELGNIGNMGSISSLMPNTRTFRSPLNIGPFFPDGGEDDRRNRPSNAPTALDRLNNFTAIMEPLSIRYLAVLLNSLATRGAQTRMEEEKTKLEAIKEASAASTTAPVAEEIITASPAATATTNTMSATTARAGQSSTTTFASFAQQETGSQAGEDQVVGVPEQEGEPAEFRVVDVVTDEEPMEVGDDTSLDGTLLPHSSAATAASSVAAAEELDDEFPPQMENPFNEPSEHQAEPTQSDQQIPPEPAETRQGAAPVTESVNVEAPPAPATEEHQYRHILGDIEIPEGVDPAFLAALPEDMRADVIRDYQRQQRAERAARPPPVPEAPAEGNEQVPLVEPINPEFLQALPPELQEEVLQQHERAVRDAQEAQRRANAPPQPEPDMDGAAVIASLPANERAQVLAEMDEAELAGLPPAMQEEARRARVNHFDPTLMRYQRLLFRGGQGRPGRGGPATGPTIGQNAGNALIASTSAPQILDRDAVMTLCLLYLADTRLSYARLQKVLKNACANAATCDFVIWSLLAILEKATEGSSDDEELVSSVPPWLETMAVVGVGHNERALRMAAKSSKVLIHSMLCVPLCRNILDLLAVIAKSYPGHFLPARLRKDKTNSGKPLPAFEHFWHMVQNMSSKVLPLPREGSTNMALQLEDSPIAHLMSYLEKANVEKSSALQDRIMKVGSAIFQTLPNKSLEIMELSDTCTPLQKHLRLVVDVLTRGSCSTEGLNDGLTFIAEAMRAFSSSTADIIYEHLFTAVQHLGKQLKPQIDMLIVELDETQKDRIDEEPSTSSAALNAAPSNASAAPYSSLVVDTTGGERVTRGRFDGDRLVIDGEQSSRLMMGASSCKELQLPAVNILTDKSGAQYTLLSSLQTLVRVRTHMRQIRDDKKKKEKEEKKQREQEEEKARVAAAGGPSTEVDAEAVAAASTAVSGDPAPAPTEPSITNEGESEKPIDLEQEKEAEEPRLSERLSGLESLWNSLSECLVRLGKASDPHAVLALQPAAEAFFLVYASQKRSDGEAPRRVAMGTSTASTSMGDNQREEMDPDTAKLVEFAEKHRQVLNQALRQNNAVLSSGGPFAILTHYPKLLDFDVKRKFFRKELSKLESSYRRNDISVQVRRSQVFSDSFRELFRLRPSDWKNRFYIIFQGEEGQDAGGLLREWFSVITREIFNPNYALFITAPGDMVTYMINKASYINPEHLEYFKFVGRLIAKSVFEHKYLDCYFTRAFYKHILNLPVRYQDLESEDPAFYKSLEFLLTNPIDELGLDLTFSTEVEEFGVRSVRDLKPNGRQLEVNDANKEEYVKLVCQMKMTGSIRQQLDAFLQGFYEIIPKTLISMFNEQELELLISGLPTVDVDDLAAHTEYKSYSKQCVQIQWFWRALRSFEKEDKAKFLQFVTGTSKVPLQGFSALEGMNGVQKFSIHMDSRGGDRLPAAHTCFNQLDLPQYESYEKLRDALLLAIRECTEGFGFA